MGKKRILIGGEIVFRKKSPLLVQLVRKLQLVRKWNGCPGMRHCV